jgi:hypothetical protein
LTLKTTVLCRTLGRACGISEYSIYLNQRLQGTTVTTADQVDPDSDVVFVEYEHGLYPGGQADLCRDFDEIKRRAPKAFIVMDYHAIYIGLEDLRWKALIGVKNGYVKVPKGILYLPHIAIESIAPVPPPQDIRLGAFGFVGPFKHYNMVIDLAIRLDVPLTLIAAAAGFNQAAKEASLGYIWTLQQKVAGHPKINLIVKFMPMEECLKELQKCSHIVSAMQVSTGSQGGPSGSLRAAIASGRPVVALRSSRAEEVGATMVNSFDEITVDWLESHRELSHVPDSFDVYEHLLSWIAAAKSVEGEILHHDAIYDEDIQRERVDWVKSNILGRAIDIGIGNGWTTNYLGCEAGVEIWPERLRYAQIRYPHIDFYPGDMTDTFPGFQTVVMAEIIEHVPYDHAKLAVARWANESINQFVLTTPNAGKKNADPGLVHNPEHVWFPTTDTVRDLCPDKFSVQTMTTTKNEDFILADFRRK